MSCGSMAVRTDIFSQQTMPPPFVTVLQQEVFWIISCAKGFSTGATSVLPVSMDLLSLFRGCRRKIVDALWAACSRSSTKPNLEISRDWLKENGWGDWLFEWQSCRLAACCGFS